VDGDAINDVLTSVGWFITFDVWIRRAYRATFVNLDYGVKYNPRELQFSAILSDPGTSFLADDRIPTGIGEFSVTHRVGSVPSNAGEFLLDRILFVVQPGLNNGTADFLVLASNAQTGTVLILTDELESFDPAGQLAEVQPIPEPHSGTDRRGSARSCWTMPQKKRVSSAKSWNTIEEEWLQPEASTV